MGDMERTIRRTIPLYDIVPSFKILPGTDCVLKEGDKLRLHLRKEYFSFEMKEMIEMKNKTNSIIVKYILYQHKIHDINNLRICSTSNDDENKNIIPLDDNKYKYDQAKNILEFSLNLLNSKTKTSFSKHIWSNRKKQTQDGKDGVSVYFVPEQLFFEFIVNSLSALQIFLERAKCETYYDYVLGVVKKFNDNCFILDINKAYVTFSEYVKNFGYFKDNDGTKYKISKLHFTLNGDKNLKVHIEKDNEEYPICKSLLNTLYILLQKKHENNTNNKNGKEYCLSLDGLNDIYKKLFGIEHNGINICEFAEEFKKNIHEIQNTFKDKTEP